MRACVCVCVSACVCVCECVCVSPPLMLLITSGMMWCDMETALHELQDGAL